MIKQEIRQAVIVLHQKGHSIREIARAVETSRNSVKKVLASGQIKAPPITKPEAALKYIDLIKQLHKNCGGNLVRVNEELQAKQINIAYSTLTAFCRRHQIGVKPKQRAGQYHFAPGREMQHDTSPHKVVVGDKLCHLECASLVLCYSRMIYAQVYPVWNRFLTKIFLNEAIRYFEGAAKQCMLDNSSVIIASGCGTNAVIAPEMEAFAQRYQTKFIAHWPGDANRSARVEGPFNYIEKNFYAGRRFENIADLNAQLKKWCERVNHAYSRKLRTKRIDLFATEKQYLNPLPLYLPEVYEIHHRIVDLMGYVNLHTNRYSSPSDFISRQVQVQESKNMVRIFNGPREICCHQRLEPGSYSLSVLAEHQHQGRSKQVKSKYLAEEKKLCLAAPQFKELITRLHQKKGNRPQVAIRFLYRMYLDYPLEALCRAIARALEYNLLDLKRIEKIVLREIGGEFFRLNYESKK
ncbi:MAG: IS21 family transposase [Methyloprofundus sp.]|nr:IS21 family transposase [Methyloprofundus sp.]